MYVHALPNYPAVQRLRPSLTAGARRQVSGAADKLDCGNPAHLQNMTRFAVLGVVRPVSALFGNPLIAKRTASSPTGSNGWFMSITATGGISARWRRATTNLDFGTSGIPLPPLQWSRFVVFFDQSASGNIIRAWTDPGCAGVWREAAFSTATNGAGAFSSDAAINLTIGNLTGSATNATNSELSFIGIWPLTLLPAPEEYQRICEHPFPAESAALLCLYPGENGGTWAPRDRSDYRVAVTATNGQAIGGLPLLWRRAYLPVVGFDASVASAVQTVTLSGGLTPSGGLVLQTTKLLTGGLTPAAALSTLKVSIVNLVGGLTPTGALVRQATKRLAGGLTPAAALVKQTKKLLAGGITPTGALSTLKVIILALGGSLTPAATIVRTTGKALAGGLTPTGAVVRRVTKLLAGVVAPAGALAKRVTKLLAGTLAPIGAVAMTLLAGGARLMKLVAGVAVTPYAAARVRLDAALAAAAKLRARLGGSPDIGPEA